MIRLLDGSANEGLATLSQILKRGQPTLGQLWTSQLSPQDTEDLRTANTILPGLRAQFEAACAPALPLRGHRTAGRHSSQPPAIPCTPCLDLAACRHHPPDGW